MGFLLHRVGVLLHPVGFYFIRCGFYSTGWGFYSTGGGLIPPGGVLLHRVGFYSTGWGFYTVRACYQMDLAADRLYSLQRSLPGRMTFYDGIVNVNFVGKIRTISLHLCRAVRSTGGLHRQILVDEA